MPRSLPVRCGRGACFGVLAAVVALALWPAAARALGVRVSPPFERDGRVHVTTALVDPFDSRVAQSLQSGMPITLSVRAELWRRRSGWFDRQESSFGAVLRIGYETLHDRYRVERTGALTEYFGTLDSLARFVTRPWSIPLALSTRVRGSASYYATVQAILRPLTLEDAAEVEGWLAGSDSDRPTAGFGLLAGLPRALFEAARGMAGFGDRQARAVSEDYSRR